MHIKSFRILNYKSFEDSGVQNLRTGFNVVVGQNNSGKTALLEALSLTYGGSIPHRSSSQAVDAPLNPHSRTELVLSTSGDEAKNALLSGGQSSFPIPPGQDAYAADALNRIFRATEFDLNYQVSPTAGAFSEPYPSHRLFEAQQGREFARIQPDPERRSLIVPAPRVAGAEDTFGTQVAAYLRGRIYCFRAERMNVGIAQFGDTTELTTNATNLPVVLNTLQGRNPARFTTINAHIRTIFSTIRHIGVRPTGGNLEISVWSVNPSTEREDLAVPLAQSGTGIGQVLAIMYVVITSNHPRTIIIDEPNTFLHPGALRKLIAILKSIALPHQYIVTTHSPEVIAVSEPQTLLMLRLENEQSKVEALTAVDVRDLRRALLEVGARFSDVFGADNVLWVEGATEQECFPNILRQTGHQLPPGTSVVALRNTGDLETRRPSAKAIWEIYERLTKANAVLPVTLAFSLDREERSDAEMEDLRRRSRELVNFLPRRTYENYLIHPRAIAAVLGSSPQFKDAPLSAARVSEWLRANGAKADYYNGGRWNGDTNDATWRTEVQAAKLLQDLFADLSGATEEYRKMTHSVRLTNWVLEHDREHLRELVEYLSALLHENPDGTIPGARL